MQNILRDILTGMWAISQEGVAAYSPSVQQLLSGVTFLSASFEAEAARTSSYSVVSAKPRSNAAREYKVAKIHITGAITKEDKPCEGPGLRSIGQAFQAAAASSDGILLAIDSPGGQVRGTDTFARMVAESPVPVLSFVDDGTMASAAYWIGSQAAEIWSSSRHNTVGSIGVMATFADMSEYWERQGIKVHEVYSRLSGKKNADFAEALKGNYEPLQANFLDKIASDFHAAVKSGRKNKKPAAEVFEGGSYASDRALELGLIDRIGTEAEALTRLAQLIEQKSKSAAATTISTKTPVQMNLKARWATLMALIGIASVDAESGKLSIGTPEADLIDARLTGYETQLADLKAERDKLQASLKTATDRVAALETENATLAAKVANAPAAGSTVVTADADPSAAKAYKVPDDLALYARLGKSKIGRI